MAAMHDIAALFADVAAALEDAHEVAIAGQNPSADTEALAAAAQDLQHRTEAAGRIAAAIVSILEKPR